MNQIKIIKNRSDIGAGTRGSDMGIDAIEIAAINSGNNYFTRFPYIDVQTHNESIYNMVKALFAKRIVHVLEQCQRVSNTVQEVLAEDYFPIVLSGDHSSALGTISGIKAQFPDKRLGVVWIDAHADLHAPFTSPSGNVHGMPLAAALGNDNLENKINEVSIPTQNIWNDLKNLGTISPKILSQDLIFFGVRDTEPTEDRVIEKQNIRNYKVAEIRHRGLQTCLSEAKSQLEDCDMIYISFDVDSLDCDLISKGTGTPVSKGFDPQEVIAIINNLMDSNKVVCLEVTEVNPLLDNKGNKMAETAFEVLDSVTNNYMNHMV
ncbi:arginase [Saprospiraceae bacterium]|jgi:arginase|nr:arginase [Bacteroidota bacterium]MDB4728441.1 arginase [Saprospiraceae bacterium]MDF1865140.1 arginase [Saprospiraceae bacterium]